MRKIVTILAIATSLALLMPILNASAEPNWGPFEPWVSFKITPSGLHIVKDPMFDPSALPEFMDPEAVPLGWIIYVCTSDKAQNLPKGLDFSVTAKGLTTSVKYDVKAYPVEGSSDFGIIASYTLGTLTANNDGEGKLSGFYDLNGPAGYEWQITVESAGEIILQTHPSDPAGFFVNA